jgi:hypothetical protein
MSSHLKIQLMCLHFISLMSFDDYFCLIILK